MTLTSNTKDRNETEDANNGKATEAGSRAGTAKEQQQLTYASKTKAKSKLNESTTIAGEGSPMKSLTRDAGRWLHHKLLGMEKTHMGVTKNGYIR